MKRQIKVIGPAKFYCKDELITIVEDFELFDLSKVLPMKILQNNLQSDEDIVETLETKECY